MIENEAETIRAEHVTLKQRVTALALKLGDEYPDLLQNYSLTMLLYIWEYEVPRHRGVGGYKPGLQEETFLNWLTYLAEQGHLVNFTSLHRAITATKRDFQSPTDRKKSLEREQAWTDSFRVEAEGWD